MTAKRKNELVAKFLNWLSANNCKTVIDTVTVRNIRIKTCTVMQLIKNKPINTICYEMFDADLTDTECWIEMLKRRCAGKLVFDRFDLFGLAKADTLEELELKLEIISS